MPTPPLFPDLAAGLPTDASSTAAAAPAEVSGRARVLAPDRFSVQMMTADLDSLLPPDHNARAVWVYVQRMDLSSLYAGVRARGSHPGRPAIDPALLMALWLFATLEGVGSARELSRLCTAHIAYRWLCGGVSVNYHALSDFRVDHVALLEALLVDGVSTLLAAGVVDMARVAQDGVRVRASAGAASFKRRKTIDCAQKLAREQVSKLKQEAESDPEASSRRQQAARLRGAEDVERRLEAAMEQMAEVEKTKRRPSKKQRKSRSRSAPAASAATEVPSQEDDKTTAARVSTTDADARVMKMGDGGFRPAFNVQFSTDVDSYIIVGVDVSNRGSDKGELEPMVDGIEADYDQLPGQALVDNGFAKLDAIEALEARGVRVVAPVQKPRDATRDPFRPLQSDGPGVSAWRTRMGTDDAKATYKLRAAVAECINAQARNRGLQQFPVRGLLKAKAIALWQALAHNLRRALTIAPHAALGAAV